MLVRRVAGRTFSDPDIVALIEEGGGLLDPYSVVRQGVNALLRQLECFDVSFEDAFERICILASLAGFDVKPMNEAQVARKHHDAVLVYTNGNGKKGTIFYDPGRPKSRIVFSIAHEIIHSFFPTSRTGARFRTICKEDSRSARELEMLCDYGASALTMPTAEFQKAVDRFGFGLVSVDSVRKEFGTSFEACLYRMGATAPFPAAAGLLRFRHRLNEGKAAVNSTLELFPKHRSAPEPPTKKYRRQSFYPSESFPRDLVIPWNKSIPETSCVYRAAKTGEIETRREVIPLDGRGKNLVCSVEAVPAPYQPPDADPNWPDILFLLRTEGQ